MQKYQTVRISLQFRL